MPRVLYICADFIVRHHVRMCIEDAGIKVTIVETKADALKRLRTSKCNLVLIQDRVEYINTFDCIESIREKYHIPILVIGKTQDPQYRIKYLQTGAAQYIQEPCDSEELIEIVRVHLRPS